MDNTEEFRCISLCTGYAGLELGLRRVIPNLRTVCYVEREGFACANLVTKIEAGKLDAAPVWTDIKTFDGRPFYKRVHIITGGYPCQPFSVAGKRKGTDDPRHLWPHIARIVEAVRPIWCFFENVSGHLSIGFPEVYRSLRLMGYKVEAGLFTAEEVGAPHKRERLFILAYNETSGCSQSNISIRQPQRQNQAKNDSVRISQMADTCISGLQKPARRKFRSIPSQTEQSKRSESCGVYAETKWPSRPGQPQYEWEEPRVVDDSTIKYDRKQYRNQQSENEAIESRRQTNRRNTELATTGKGQTQSRLGRAVNGHSSRVDRLRLLGNGVVPQQAELAFRTLLALFSKR